ncbi:hypothetical protein ACFV8T_40900 [Streptomyces sp. NPDC059832]|uniref:hypothetical protein n=1 Tax=unclassified Streptomyces TaxID=2593676 RepID=UPI0036484175
MPRRADCSTRSEGTWQGSRPVPVAHEPVAAGPNADLSVTSQVWTDLASSPFLNIEEGMRAVRSDLRYRLGLN